ncbi:MAG: HAD family hydrolase [Candidatus Baldrarchaeia archaeon]
MIKVIFFDLDETLYDYGSVRKAANQRVARLVEELELTSSDVFIQTLRRITKDFYEKYQGLPLLFDRKIRFQEVFKALNIDVSREIIVKLANEYWNFVYQQIKPYPDVVPVLELLRKQGYRLGIISDGLIDVQLNRIKALKLEKYFDTFTFSEEVGKNKPALEIFRLALRKTKCNPSEAIMVGDNVKTDIAGANKVGITSVWIRRGIFKDLEPNSELESPNYTIYNLNELIYILYKIRSA